MKTKCGVKVTSGKVTVEPLILQHTVVTSRGSCLCVNVKASDWLMLHHVTVTIKDSQLYTFVVHHTLQAVAGTVF